jgi:hypothetical protein
LCRSGKRREEEGEQKECRRRWRMRKDGEENKERGIGG